MELTDTERVILANQYRILAALYPGDAEHYERLRAIVGNGYVREYSRIRDGIHTELSKENCDEVVEILDMFRMIQDALRGIADTDGITLRNCEFRGFDGNGETDHLAYADFLINTEGRWAESKREELNSHTPMLDRYRQMLGRWDQSENKHSLNREDLIRIAGSA